MTQQRAGAKGSAVDNGQMHTPTARLWRSVVLGMSVVVLVTVVVVLVAA
jgi:hypothetical protein